MPVPQPSESVQYHSIQFSISRKKIFNTKKPCILFGSIFFKFIYNTNLCDNLANNIELRSSFLRIRKTNNIITIKKD